MNSFKLNYCWHEKVLTRASAFVLDCELSIFIYGVVRTLLPKAGLFSQAKWPRISLSLEDLPLNPSMLCYLVALVNGNIQFFNIAFKLRCSKGHMDFKNQEGICHLLPSFGFVAAEGEAQHVFCLPIRTEGTGESLQRNGVTISWAYAVHTDRGSMFFKPSFSVLCLNKAEKLRWC